ncbi:MAG: hypothetical protein WEB53_09775, partial [Akkermansiaceae bacterium]
QLNMTYFSRFSKINLLFSFIILANSARADVTPDRLEFRRMATQRMFFDRIQEIPLAGLNPSKVVGLELMHPFVGTPTGNPTFEIQEGLLKISAQEASQADRWIGGFNPFASYDLLLDKFNGSGSVGILFRDSDEDNRISATLVFSNGICSAVRWVVVKQGKEVERKDYPLPADLKPVYPLRFRVQMLAVGVNLFLETNRESHLIAYPNFAEHFELREKSLMRRFEFCLHSDLIAGSAVSIREMTAALSPGCGQADIRAITRPDGEPLIDQGRFWFTMTVRGRALPHPMQGVFSMNPSVFDLKFEGIIVFDMGDGMLRNELASHLFYDDASKEWRGWTVGFSAYGKDAQGAQKAVLAVSSKQDPRKGFSIMHAKPVGLPSGMHEDPHGVYDADAGKWRMLLAEHAGKFRASMWESDKWDQGYTRIAGPVDMDSTGTSIQKIGSKRYAMFGSADRKVYVRSYPGLEPAGELNIHLPPWDDQSGTRIWPNVLPLPDGYPARYIALMMDRLNYPGMPKQNWTYGAMYLYHAHAPENESHPYEYQQN